MPVVQAPPEVLLQSSEMWKEHIIAQFHGTLPSRDKIYADLNPVWGKFGNISLHKVSDSACLILIPSIQTREWVLQVGYWQADHCAFSVFPWSADGNFDSLELKSAPTWAVLKNLPPQLYSLDGISVVASAIGEPLHTEKSRLEPYRFGDTKVKIEITLNNSPPEVVVVRDTAGNSVNIAVTYPSLPPKCCNCGKFGHLLNHCPKPLKKKRIAGNVQKNRKEKDSVLVVSTSTKIGLVEEEVTNKTQVLVVDGEVTNKAQETRIVNVQQALTENIMEKEEVFVEALAETRGQSKRRHRSRSRARDRARARSASCVDTATQVSNASQINPKTLEEAPSSSPGKEEEEISPHMKQSELEPDSDAPWITKNSKWARRALRQEELWKANLTKSPLKKQSFLFTRGSASGKKV